MVSILTLFAGNITKSLSNRVTNNEISRKSTHSPLHQDLAVPLMDTPGFCLQF